MSNETEVGTLVGHVQCSCGWRYIGVDLVNEFSAHAKGCKDGARRWTARQWESWSPLPSVEVPLDAPTPEPLS